MGAGMDSMGKMKPESMNVGSSVAMMDTRKAFCWVVETDEMNRPSPRQPIKNKREIPSNRPRLPLISTPKTR
jgi:hypothetical protein